MQPFEKYCEQCRETKGLHNHYIDSMNTNEKEKIPCDCPKGGVYSDGKVCQKCNGTEYVPQPPTKQDWEERLEEFAIINEFYIRGVPMGKIKAFISQEIIVAEERGEDKAFDKAKAFCEVHQKEAKEDLIDQLKTIIEGYKIKASGRRDPWSIQVAHIKDQGSYKAALDEILRELSELEKQ